MLNLLSIAMSYFVLSSGLAQAAPSDVRPTLAVGQIEKIASLPFSLIEKENLNFMCVPSVAARCEPFPSTTPLSVKLTELPDIISCMAGYYENDLANLINQDLIEPLDPIFQELGIDPKTYYPENVYAAVSARGKIWAIPHRVQIYLFRYDKRTFKKLGFSPDMSSLEELLFASDKISREASPGERVAGFYSRMMSGDKALGVAIQLLQDAILTNEDNLPGLIMEHKEGLAGYGVDTFTADSQYAIKLGFLNDTTVGASTGIIPMPTAIRTQGKKFPEQSLISFMESFAVRKGDKTKHVAAMEFVKWLLKKETQLGLVNNTRFDKTPSDSMQYRHIPLATSVQESPEFLQIVEEVPEYKVVLDSIKRSEFAHAEPGSYSNQHESVLKLAQNVKKIHREQSELSAYLYLFSQYQTLKNDNAKPVATPVATKSFSKY